MKLEWSQCALDDRDKIFDYIEQDNPHAAIAVDNRISEQVKLLAQFPEGGRTGRVEGTRELVISRTSYIVAYRISGNVVHILRVLHSAQFWPDDMPDT
ncbi:type II toxin-antitoxin system RelE/ParE family toxin [Noviherbaspirillum sedimenti]|uniref:Type II toxin-antitoxin system RelE/ParE family toxin n=1 Tax=Noviherbaspirillum sedimenti TaxID=2320865 RepID=A0A3A3GAE7_9BURK|nr:type II toxin-antitoxin system RelE/ParE family toxin [Noviherbaspirillum sedimenti]RJG03582.1 type II toxin-antitoxin system RelE/ParE family toxin [Noviherbaspirillum sedimenti]